MAWFPAPPPFWLPAKSLVARPAPRVNFVVVGVQKGGTSALFHFLSQHPGIAVPRHKELHFFDDDRRRWGRPAYADYHRHFGACRDGLRGEATPTYIWWPNALERLARYNPEMRIIALFRDPVTRAHAHWRMNRDRGYEPLDFSTAIRAGLCRIAVGLNLEQALRRFSYLDRGFYAAQVERLFALFPREQVLLLRQDDLEQDHDGTLRRVFAFLGLPHHRIPASRVFEGAVHTPLADQDASFLSAIYEADIARFAALSGCDTAGWWKAGRRGEGDVADAARDFVPARFGLRESCVHNVTLTRKSPNDPTGV